MELKGALLTLTALISGWLTFVFGEWSYSFNVLLFLFAVDMVTGFIVAGVFNNSSKSKNGGLSSNAGAKGIIKKVMLVFIVAIANMVGNLFVISGIPIGATLREMTIWCLIFNELLSIVENAGQMGVEFPEPLVKAIDILESKIKDDKEDK